MPPGDAWAKASRSSGVLALCGICLWKVGFFNAVEISVPWHFADDNFGRLSIRTHLNKVSPRNLLWRETNSSPSIPHCPR